MTKIKICGIRNIDIAQYTIACGASALGFNFYEKSVRNISIENARDIIKGLPAIVSKVGIFVDKSENEIIETVRATGIDTIQLHGDYDLDFALHLKAKTPFPVIFAVRINDLTDTVIRKLYDIDINTFLFDKLDENLYGGSGKSFYIAANLSSETLDFIGKKVIIAGGINSRNISGIVKHLSPYAVDLSSSVETAPGVKDKFLIENFFIKFNSALRLQN
jgi:phosphoribosylanthranilate isomerase